MTAANPRGASAGDAQAQRLAERAAAAMWAQDRASQGLGMRLTEIAPGRARLSMRVRPDMVNGHDICHGGFVFALADSAFAFACNSHNEATVAAAGAIDFLAPARAGDELTAQARELWRSGKNGLYEITVTNQRGECLALLRGRSHRVSGRLVEPE